MDFTFGKQEGRRRKDTTVAMAGRPVLLAGREVGFVFNKFRGSWRAVCAGGFAWEHATRKAAAEMIIKHATACN